MNRKGVTIPSQIRYIGYFRDSLANEVTYSKALIFGTKVKIQNRPKYISVNDFELKIAVWKSVVFDGKGFTAVDKVFSYIFFINDIPLICIIF